MRGRELFDSFRSAIARKHDASSSRPRDLWDTAPPGLAELLQSSERNLRQQGITQAAANEWSLRLTRGEVPSVDAQNNPMKFASIDEFSVYTTQFLPQPKVPKRNR